MGVSRQKNHRVSWSITKNSNTAKSNTPKAVYHLRRILYPYCEDFLSLPLAYRKTLGIPRVDHAIVFFFGKNMQHTVFVNRILNMKKIKWIGLDMDHTLIRYQTKN